jgi:hypothetical protein
MSALWATEELATVELGDARLDARAVLLLATLGNCPSLSIPAACGGRAELAAAYRFFDNDRVTFDAVLQPHHDRARQRVADQAVALLVQDTSEVDLTRPEQEVVGAGALDGSRRGVLLHALHGFTPEGTPLGTAWAEVLDRPDGVSHAPPAAKRRDRQRTPIEDKESLRWLTGLRQARQLAQQCPRTQCVCVADSEADVYEVFAEPRGARPVHWLIRACQDRAVAGAAGYLRDQALAAPVAYTVELHVRGRQAKTAAEDRARRRDRPPRRAAAEVRAAALALRPPGRPDRELPPVTANVVAVREPAPPPGAEPVEWLLLTTLPIGTPEQVRAVVAYYCVRWQIEVLFRVLKSGCRIERRRFEHLDRLLPCLALYLIAAWRTLLVCRLGRECPDVACEALFEPSEWKAVWAAVHHRPPPKRAPRLAEMVHLVARLGGYVGRPKSEPGVQTLWIGLQRMYDLAWAWDCFGPGSRIRNG